MTLNGLAAIVGERNLLDAPEDLARYDIDGRQGGGAALAVVRPGSTEEVSALVRAAHASGHRLVPQGARSGLVGAGLADRQIVLSLERLNGAPVIDAVNRTAEVEAGVLLSSLNAAAGEHGLYFPIDLGADPSIGGMVSANTGGARLLRHGDVRRNLLGLEVVLSDPEGTILRFGRGLWKDNSGLDLKQLWIGGAGSLGIVTRATVALQPKPANRITALIALDRPEVAVELIAPLEAGLGTLLTAFEGMSRPGMEAALAHVPRLRLPFAGGVPPYAILVELSGGAALSEAMLADALASTLEPWMDGAKDGLIDIAVAHDDGLWTIRHAIPEGLRASGKVIGCDVSLRRGDVMRFRADLIDRLAAAAPQLRLCDFGHIGDGGMHFNLVWPPEAGPYVPAEGEAARAMIFDAVVNDYGGSFSAEHGLGPVNAPYYAKLVPATERRLAGRIQQLVAPQPIGRVDFDMEDRG